MRRPVLGWTLIELLVCLTLIGVLLGMAVPWGAELVELVRWKSNVGDAYLQMGQARLMAVQKQQMITLCPSQNGLSCERDWQGPWIVFADHNGNGVIDGRDQLVHSSAPRSLNGELRWRSFRNLPYLQFTLDGQTNSVNGTLAFCDGRGRVGWDRKIVINRIGRARVVTAAVDGRLPECLAAAS